MLRRKRKNLAEDEEDNTKASGRLSMPSQKKRNSSPFKRPLRNEEPVEKVDSLFCQLLMQAGVKMQDGVLNQLDDDQAIFQRELKKILKTHARYPVIVDDFIESLKLYLSDQSKLEALLMPTETAPQCKSSRGGEQDSLLRLLVGIDILQTSLISWLLEKVAEFSIMEENAIGQGANVPILILSQLRWLSVLVDSKGLSDKMLEILPVLPLDLQKKVIVLFPEILHDSEHSEVAKKLSEMMIENKNLVMVIAESLATLNVQAEDIIEVKLSVLDLLQTVPLEEIPTLIFFLLNNILPDQTNQIVSELRLKLDLITSLIPMSSSTPAKNNYSLASAEKYMGIRIMEACLSACRWQKSVCDAWIKAIEKLSTNKDHLPIDLIMVFLLYSMEPRRKNLESLVRSKIRAGHFNLDLLKNTIKHHSKVIKEHLECILRLANVMLRSFEPPLSKFGSAIYKELFIRLDKYCQQEVIGQLMTHVGSRMPSETDAALDVLCSLSQDNKEGIAPFSSFLKSLLDYLDFLSLNQIRVVYSLLSELAYKAGPEGAMVQDELRIVIRKQVTHSNLKYMRMGVVGALMAAKAMCIPRVQDSTHNRLSAISLGLHSRRSELGECSSQASSVSSSLMEKTYSQETIQLLDLVKKSCSAYAETTALFYDELSRLIQKGWLDDKVEVWINDIMLNSFQEDFIIDIKPTINLGSAHGIELELRLSNPGGADTDVAVNIAKNVVINEPGIHHGSPHRNHTTSASTVAAQFRLLRICEHCQHDGDLTEIDVLSMCPIVMPKWEDDPAVFSKNPPETKNFICLAIVHCSNWIREVINAFVGQKDKDIKAVVVQNLRHLVKLQDTLQQFVSETPGFVFPLAVFDQLDLELTTAKQKPKPSAAKNPKEKKGKKKSSNEDDEDDATTQNQKTQKNKGSPKTQPSDGKGKVGELKKVPVDLSNYRASFRELDLEAFVLLHNGLQVSSEDSQSSPPIDKMDPLKLKPTELLFLLDDLYLKVDHALPSSNPKRFSFLKARNSKQAGFSNLSLYTTPEIVKTLVDILPSLLSLLEDCTVYFQNILTRNDGVLDGPGMESELTTNVASCMALLFRILNTLISWCGFQEDEYSNLYKDAMAALSSQTNKISRSAVSLKSYIRHAFEHLYKYEEILPTVGCGVALIRLLETLSSHPKAGVGLQHQTSNLAKALLTKPWPNLVSLKGSKHCEHIQTLLSTYISNGEQPMKCLEDVCTVSIPEILQTLNEEATSHSYPTLTKHTFGAYHRVILHQLTELVKNFDTDEEDSEIIKQWNTSVNIFSVAITVVKAFAARPNLLSCLKYGRLFVESFNKQCMPILDKQFVHRTESIVQLIKGLQGSTRSLQHICGHAKAKKDVSLTRYVPLVKKTLEIFVFRVKGMMERNKCKDAFWIGNLKNRDIHGEEILSQQNVSVSDEDEDEDAEEREEEDEQAQEAPEAKSDNEAEDDAVKTDSNNEDEESEEY